MLRPDEEELFIVTDGRKLSGWQEVSVTRGVERIPSVFYISATDRAPEEAHQLLPRAGVTCQVYLSGDLIMSGFIDVVEIVLNAGQHQLRIAGRSKTQDVIDSQIDGNEIGAWEFVAETVGEAARRIVKPFNINVTGDALDEKIPPPHRISINPGATGGQILEDIARSAAVLLWDNEKGELVFSHIGTERAGTALVEGQNLEIGHAVRRTDIRFSDYIVVGADYVAGSSHKNTRGHAEDPEMKKLGRHRTKLILWEGPDQLDETTGLTFSQRRAIWEANRRYGRGNLVNVTVTGWRGNNDKLWTPNTVVAVNSPNLKAETDFIISEVTWHRSGDSGTTTALTLMPPEALKPQPFAPNPAFRTDLPGAR